MGDVLDLAPLLLKMERLTARGVPLPAMARAEDRQAQRLRFLRDLYTEAAKLADQSAAWARSDEEEAVLLEMKTRAEADVARLLVLDNEGPKEGA